MIIVFLGIDIGTTRIKTTLVDKNGRVVRINSKDIHLEFGSGGRVEIDPKSWIIALKDLLKNQDLEGVEAVGLSGQMHSLILIDEDNEPVRKAIVWADSRGIEEQNFLLQNRSKSLLERCGNLPNVAFTLVKLLYLIHNEPESVKRAKKICLSKDFVGGWLTGNFETDYTDASATLMFNLMSNTWDEEILSDLGVPRNLLPDINKSLSIRGYLKKDVANEVGMKPGIPVIYGAGDQESAAYGSGVIKPGDIMLSVSTGSQILIPVESPRIDPKIHNFRHVHGYHVMGAVQNAGLFLEWAIENFGFSSYEELTESAKESPMGSNGVIFLPYITPERTPLMSQELSGILVNMKSETRRSDISRAMIEGMVMNVFDAWLYMENLLGIRDGEIKLLGGVFKNEIVVDMFTHLMNGKLDFVEKSIDPSSFGASLMAGKALGYFEKLGEVIRNIVSHSIVARRDEDYLEIYRNFLNARSKIFNI